MEADRALTPMEADLLLHLEKRLVEHGGSVRADLLRPEELALLRAWSDAGFLRIEAAAGDAHHTCAAPFTQLVDLSEQAWHLAARLRRRHAAQQRAQPIQK